MTSLASNGYKIGLHGRPRRQQPTPDETPVFAHSYRKIKSYQDLMSSRIIVIDDDEAIRPVVYEFQTILQLSGVQRNFDFRGIDSTA